MSGGWVSFELKGMKELDEALRGLPEDLQRKALEAATREGAKIVLAEAQQTSQFSDRTGNLRKSLKVKLNREAKQAGGFSYHIGADARGFYGYFIEKGFTATGPRGTSGFETYTDRRGRKRVRALAKRGAGKTSRDWRAGMKKDDWRHVAARPFLRPALENNVEAVTRAIQNRLSKRIDLYVKKYQKGGR